MAVVDYMIFPTKSFEYYRNFKVVDPIDVVTEHNLEIDSKVPDHRLIIVESYSCNLATHNGERVIPIGAIKTMPDNFMQDHEVLQKLEKNSLWKCVSLETLI